jgi:hypothetical protein
MSKTLGLSDRRHPTSDLLRDHNSNAYGDSYDSYYYYYYVIMMMIRFLMQIFFVF